MESRNSAILMMYHKRVQIKGQGSDWQRKFDGAQYDDGRPSAQTAMVSSVWRMATTIVG